MDPNAPDPAPDVRSASAPAPAPDAAPDAGGMPVLHVAGSPADMGRAHGAAFRDDIRRFARERVALAGDPDWSGRELDRDGVLELAERCLDAHRAWSPELGRELDGMAEATGLSAAEIVVVGGFTDFIDAVHAVGGRGPARRGTGVDDCTSFLVPGARAADGRALFGQTWDMHETATEHVLLLRGRPDGAPAFDAFTSAGCVGMIGMNEHGVTVGINNLLGADGRVGVTWPFVVREVLRQRDLESALACVLDADLAGAHEFLLLDGEGRGAEIEAFPTARTVTRLEGDALAHTNHALHEASRRVERAKDEEALAHSERRLVDARRLLDRRGLTPEDLMRVTADGASICYRGGAPRFVATCGGVVARPATRELWAVRGLPSENAYARFSPAEAVAPASA